MNGAGEIGTEMEAEGEMTTETETGGNNLASVSHCFLSRLSFSV